MNKLKFNKCINCGELHFIITKSKLCLLCYARQNFEIKTSNNQLFPNYPYEYTKHPQAIRYLNIKKAEANIREQRKNQIFIQSAKLSERNKSQLDNLSEENKKITADGILDNS